MSNAGTDTETEDVLASIRRLVSQDAKPSEPKPEPPAPAVDVASPDQSSAEYLVLTASQRISRRVAEVVAARDAASMPVAPETARSLADELARLESSIAELEAVVVPRPADEAAASDEEAPFIEMTGDDDVMLDFPAASQSQLAANTVVAMSPVQVVEQATIEPDLAVEPEIQVEPEDDVETDVAVASKPEVEDVPEGATANEAQPLPEVAATEIVASEVTPTDLSEEGDDGSEPDLPQPMTEAEPDVLDLTPAFANVDAVPEQAFDPEEASDLEPEEVAPSEDTKAEDSTRPIILRGGAVYDADDEDDEDEDDVSSDRMASIDEDSLRAMVAQLIREELRGVLGERITTNVRKLVRREIQRVMRDQGQD